MRRACDICGVREAVVYQPHTKRALCLECFVEDVVKRVKREVERWSLIRALEPSSRKVVEIDLGTTRESLTYEEFLAKVKDATEKQGVRISDRSWSTAMAKVKAMKGRVKASQA